MVSGYIDLHCDTAYELYHQRQGLMTNTLAISLQVAECYPSYAQFFAVWSDSRLSDGQAYDDFIAIADHFKTLLTSPPTNERACLVRTSADLRAAWEKGKHAAFLAVEDARLLQGKLERLETLAERGVAYLTLLWGGNTCIGGSHDTDNGLTDFGKAVVKGCFELGIVPDVSHASEQSAEDILLLAERYGRPVIATHSNYFSVYPHSRNLRDDHFRRICELGGVVGLNLCRHHLRDCTEQNATAQDALRHLDHALMLGGEHAVAIGGDLDGAALPDGISTVADVTSLAKTMQTHGYADTQIQDIFYRNAHRFIEKNFV